MNLGTIVYYILWPLVGMAIVINWVFGSVSFFVELCTDMVRGFHSEIKKL